MKYISMKIDPNGNMAPTKIKVLRRRNHGCVGMRCIVLAGVTGCLWSELRERPTMNPTEARGRQQKDQATITRTIVPKGMAESAPYPEATMLYTTATIPAMAGYSMAVRRTLCRRLNSTAGRGNNWSEWAAIYVKIKTWKSSREATRSVTSHE